MEDYSSSIAKKVIELLVVILDVLVLGFVQKTIVLWFQLVVDLVTVGAA
jgi:hypothetical protein